MIIASRTPEGEPARCPVCGRTLFLEPLAFYGDAPCPACGSLLWFIRLGGQNVLVQPQPIDSGEGLIGVLSRLSGFSKDELLADPGVIDQIDSLQLLELAMMLEDE